VHRVHITIYWPTFTHHLVYSISHINYSSDAFRCSPTPPSGSPENYDVLVNKRWHFGINLWSQKKKGGPNNYSRTRRTPPTNHIMWWHCVNEYGQIDTLGFHLSTALRASFIAEQNECHVQFSFSYPTKIPAHETPTCLTVCVVDFVNRIFLNWLQMQQFFSAIRTDNADMSIFWACRNDDFLGDISVLATISSS